MFHKHLRGQDLHAPSRELIENNSIASIAKLKVVSLDGMGTAFPQIKICAGAADTPFGISETDIASGKTGTITCLGFMYSQNTSSWTEGTTLYADASGSLTSTVNGSPVATVAKSDAVNGVLYVIASVASFSADNSWSLDGNDNINPGKFLGTTNAQPLEFRTNNNTVGRFDASGNFGIGSESPKAPLYIKPYTGYTGSGYRLEPFTVTSNSVTPVSIYSVTLTNNQVVRIKYQVTGRQSDGTKRCSFTRSALFYRENANVAIQGRGWQSDFTSKSDNNFNVGVSMGTHSITFTVKAATSTTTYWAGHVEMEVISNDV